MEQQRGASSTVSSCVSVSAVSGLCPGRMLVDPSSAPSGFSSCDSACNVPADESDVEDVEIGFVYNKPFRLQRKNFSTPAAYQYCLQWSQRVVTDDALKGIRCADDPEAPPTDADREKAGILVQHVSASLDREDRWTFTLPRQAG